MKIPSGRVFLLGLAMAGVTGPAAAAQPGPAPVTLAGVEYIHRWAQDEQHEFTPGGQEDLEHWADMVTITHYRSVKDGDALAATANTVLGNYKANRAMVLRTDAVPRTADKPAEYLMVVLFPRPDFIEAVFARFKLVDGVGASVVYSHREYGRKIGDVMSAWLKQNGPPTEKALMGLEKIPDLPAVKK